jgi:hypothetical protein
MTAAMNDPIDNHAGNQGNHPIGNAPDRQENGQGNKQRVSRFRSFQMILGGAAGGIASAAFMILLSRMGFRYQVLRLIDLCGFLLGISFACSGFFVFAISFSPSWTGRQLEQDPSAPPANVRERGLMRMQGAVLLLAGILVVIPQLAVLAGWVTRSAPIIYAGVVLGFLLQTVLNIQVWRQSDEFVRALVAKSSMFTFWILQGVLFLVAAGEKLGLLPEFPLWGACIVMLGFYFVGGIVFTVSSTRR